MKNDTLKLADRSVVFDCSGYKYCEVDIEMSSVGRIENVGYALVEDEIDWQDIWIVPADSLK